MGRIAREEMRSLWGPQQGQDGCKDPMCKGQSDVVPRNAFNLTPGVRENALGHIT